MADKDERGRFTKGNQAGTRSKRTMCLAAMIKAQTKDGKELVDRLLVALRNGKTANKDIIAIVKLLLSYSHGNPVQQVDANIGGNLVFRWEEDPSTE